MFCPKCRNELPQGSAFCNRCGAALGGSPLAAPAGPPSGEAEEELWKGRFSGKAYAHWWFLWLIAVAGAGYLWFVILPEKFRLMPALRWVGLGVLGLPALVLLWKWFVQRLATRYRVTTHRFFKETGIFSRHINEIELIRVDDVSVRQNLLQRIFNVGVIVVIAPTDQTEPRVEIVGVSDPIEVKEIIRAQVRKRRDRSLHVESL